MQNQHVCDTFPPDTEILLTQRPCFFSLDLPCDVTVRGGMTRILSNQIEDPRSSALRFQLIVWEGLQVNTQIPKMERHSKLWIVVFLFLFSTSFVVMYQKLNYMYQTFHLLGTVSLTCMIVFLNRAHPLSEMTQCFSSFQEKDKGKPWTASTIVSLIRLVF